uniref:Uncharacterized protein n=1 Tax=Cyanidium caldarium TaxID=2771 RepID=O19923_CYACA|nr:hypothetical protein JXY51_pgp126 [Cyanidium caldarium]AAB82666.1 unknown [Cyanidium caldarium]
MIILITYNYFNYFLLTWFYNQFFKGTKNCYT